jgi:hypothetical protein
MASTYSPLKVELIGTGEQAGTWGTTTNTNLGTALEEAITGRATATFPSDANFTLPYIDSNAAQVFRNLVLNVTSSGNLSATRDLIIPAIEKQYIVENNTSGSQSIRVKTAAGTGVTIPNGRIANVFCDGTNTRLADDFVDINGGAIDGTPIGAASASTGAFTTITATSATLTAASITGGAVNGTPIGAVTPSTGAFTTLTATSAILTAASITGGAVNGTPIGATTPSTGAFTTSTISGNLAFTGNSNRITGNFSDTTIANQVMFQTSNPNTLTRVQAIPNGTPTVPSDASSAFLAFNSSDPTNSANVNIQASLNEAALRASITGTGTFLPLTFYTSGAERVRIAENGDTTFYGDNVIFSGNGDTTFYGDNVIFSGNGKRIKGNFIPYSGDATLFQTTVSAQGTSLGVIPNGGVNDTSIVFYAGTDPANTNFLAAYSANNGTYIDSGSVGTGTTQNFRIITNGSSRIDVAASGEVSVNTATDANTSLIVSNNGRTYSLKADARVQFSAAYGYTVGATNRTLFIDSAGDIGGLSSTRESKTNITPIQDADWLMSLEPVSYNRRERDNNGAYTEEANKNTEYGLIADDVATIRPEICVFVDGKVSGISYEQLIAPMLKEIQKLRAEVNELKEKLNG